METILVRRNEFRAHAILDNGQSMVMWLPVGEYTGGELRRVPVGRDRPGEYADAREIIDGNGHRYQIGESVYREIVAANARAERDRLASECADRIRLQ